MKNKHSIIITIVFLLIVSMLTSCSVQSIDVASEQEQPNKAVIPQKQQPHEASTSSINVHFIDVGQGDCSFIQLADGRTILIDGGNKADAEKIINYLKNLDIISIDYLIATHPHEDHIGSLPTIIREFKIGSIYMPKVTATTNIFKDLLLSIKEKGYKINTAMAEVRIIDTEDTKLTLLAPASSEYGELNNYSVVTKLSYKNTAFLLTGDAEDISENEILKANLDLKADVLKVGHHGGRTSTTKGFLAMVKPKYAVISVGKDNDYGHPHRETMERLNVQKVNVFRTDEQGSIVASSNGNTVTINKSPVVLSEAPAAASNFYIGNKNSKVFHLQSCTALPKPENQVELKSKTEALNAGFKPCQRCKP